tara:strand:- start:1429 stop:1836 length:408 start_codon:yes stop_codon:yes gene_type:complete
MAIEGVGSIFNNGSGAIGEVTNINIPDDEVKEYEVTTLGDTREQFQMSAMSVGQECTLTIRLNPETPPITTKDQFTGATITLSKQTAGSASGAVYTFDCFVKMVTGGTADVASTEGITQDVTMRLTSEVVVTDEA